MEVGGWAEEEEEGERISGGFFLRFDCRGWMETIKQHSKGGTVVTQQWCRYVTKLKHTTRRVCVCMCVSAYDMKRWLTALWDQELRTL